MVDSERLKLSFPSLKVRCVIPFCYESKADPTGVAPVPWELQSHALLTELQIDIVARTWVEQVMEDSKSSVLPLNYRARGTAI